MDTTAKSGRSASLFSPFRRPDQFYTNLPVLLTPRLKLRSLTLDDADGVFEYASDERVTPYVQWNTHKTVEQSRGFLKDFQHRATIGTLGTWGIERIEDGRFLGTIAMFDWDTHHGRAEIGYVMARKYWGHGYMTETVQAVLDCAFNTLDLRRIHAYCVTENAASAAVMERAGMKHEGTLRDYVFLKGSYRDMRIYAILREEFMAAAVPEAAAATAISESP